MKVDIAPALTGAQDEVLIRADSAAQNYFTLWRSKAHLSHTQIVIQTTDYNL